MKRFLLALCAGVLCMNEPSFAQDEMPFDASATATEGDVIAFVGKKVFVRADELWPPEQDPSSDDYILYMDSRYQARYEIESLVSGDYKGRIIDFLAYDHYGMPRVSTVENALIFVHDGPESKVYSKYNFYEVHRTTDGDWAACGDAYVQNDPEETEKEPLEVISFLNPVEVNVPSIMYRVEDEFEPDEIVTDTQRAEIQVELDEENAKIEGLYQAPIWVREGSKATCRMGTRVADLLEYQNETRFLPNKRYDICEERYSVELDALENDYKAKRAIIDDCTSILKIQNLP
ncbi:MAG: hypothetical protein ABJN22_11000 [Litorimonas sp.]